MSLLTNVVRRSINKTALNNFKQVRHSHGPFVYRETSKPDAWAKNCSVLVATVGYWWLYWNAYHDFDVLVAKYGGQYVPNPKDWTDEELGIPPDDA